MARGPNSTSKAKHTLLMKNMANEAERFEHFFYGITDYALYTLSPDGLVMNWNAGAENCHGYQETEIRGQHFALLYPEDVRSSGHPVQVLQAARQCRFEEESWLTKQDGTLFWGSLVINPISDTNGIFQGYALITRDITEQKRRQEALHATEEQFRLLVQGVTDYAIYLLSPEGVVTNWNAGAERIKGYRSDEVVGTHFSRFYTPEDRAAGLPALALHTAATKGKFEREGWRIRKDGTRFWAHVIIDPVRNQMGDLIGYAKVTRDVTERREAEQALAQAKDALFQSQKMEAIGNLTGGISHDFNNLLNVISNGLHVLRMESDRKARFKTIEAMERATKRGTALTQQLLAFARQQPNTLDRVNINKVLGSFEAVLRRAVPSSINLEFQLADDLPDIMADLAQLEAALLNLVVNATHAIHETGTITIATAMGGTKFIADLNSPKKQVQVQVRDTGIGMSDETKSRAIEPFFTTKPVGKGSGLGLSQVFGMTSDAGGSMHIDSSLGHGTCITLNFPAIERSNSAEGNARPTGKVLVVDDQADVLDITAQLFKLLGYEVISANSGADALDALKRHNDIDVLFSDLMMPDMTGLELARNARQAHPDTEVILTTGHPPSLMHKKHPGLEQFPLLAKPYTLADIARFLDISARCVG